MKHLMLPLLLFSFYTTFSNANPNTQPQATAKADNDQDGKVVAENMGVMLQALGTFASAPNNPVIAGAAALQALGAFIKILIQVFDFAPTRTHASQEEIKDWFMNLPKEKQIKVMQLMIAYAHLIER
ncbi:hypothetical protein BH09DEP1_BH09DEP1_5700 [soil metagenome]